MFSQTESLRQVNFSNFNPNGNKYYAIDITTPDADNIYKVKAQVKKTETKLIEAKDL